MTAPKDLRGYRYQVAEPSISQFWAVLDMHIEGEAGHPIVCTEITRAAARDRAKELNARWLRRERERRARYRAEQNQNDGRPSVDQHGCDELLELLKEGKR